MKIKSLEIENFKLFIDKFDKIKDISNSDIIILNGPNGYGKTSIFDAIEFALTGKIKRINNYSNELGIGKRSAYDKKILIADETKFAYIKLWLQDKEDSIEIQRVYTPDKSNEIKASVKNNPHKIFEIFETKISINGIEVDEKDAKDKTKRINDIADFYDKCCFLSQDEHLEFLKATKKDKASALEFLFEIPEEQQKEINRVDELINKLMNSNTVNNIGYIAQLEKKAKEIDSQINDIEINIKKTNRGDIRDTEYQCLFPKKSLYWDKESIIIDPNKYDESIEEVRKLLYFASNQNTCLDYLYNKPYKKILKPFIGNERYISNQNQLEYAYRYYSLLTNQIEIESKYELHRKYKNLKILIEKINLEKINWGFIIDQNLLDEVTIVNIRKKLEEVIELKKTQKTISKVITNITSTRTNLINYINKGMDEDIITDNQCPLCGTLYSNRQKLDEDIKKETDVLQFLCDESAIKINCIVSDLYNNHFNDLLNNIEDKLKDTISDELYKKLQEVKGKKIVINEINQLLKNIGIELPDKYECEIEKIEDGYKNLVEKINNKLKVVSEDIESQLETKDFIHEYEKYYDKNKEEFKRITSKMLSLKENYIKISFYNNEMKELNLKKREYNILQKRIGKLKEIHRHLKGYREAIQKGIDSYKRKIIQDIEPILYVYTAKILQQKFNGKSIFISFDKEMKNIKFINSVNDAQDILYTMSSGQLAAVSLAFLLCMNQVYAKHALPILLIDDPIQTIDDVNMVGLVDILRYEFMDRQIFISTHEQKFEWYLKYKYEKADKIIKPFNMKNLIL